MIFIRSLHKGGAEKQAILLCKGLIDKGVDAMLIVLYEEGDLLEYAKLILKKDQLIFIKNGNLLKKAFHFKFLLRKLQVHSIVCFLPVNNIIGILSAGIVGVPTIVGGIRGSKIKDSKLKMKLQKVLFNRFSTAIVSNSFKGREVYQAYGIDPKKMRTIHNGFPVETFKTNSKRNISKIQILSVGRFVEEKDYNTAILTISYLKKLLQGHQIDWEYTIIGYGTLENNIRELIETHCLGKEINLIINPPNIKKYYSVSDIFLMTSRFEGMPNAVMEAMSFKLPVVCTKAGDTDYLVSENFNGFLKPIGDWKNLAESLKILMFSPSLRIEMGYNGRTRLVNRFGVDLMVEKYLNLLQENV
ncbi:glycosyltransferase [uncultured Christiangramia sp.]|uniref:glycosyltransferase n=1 Tax=Christiangramia sp. 3-2217-3z TaxID=3417564 RepID=UPI002611454D|nr:glycosyltransferase [uncultured Christiangramia sp.]